MKTNDIRIGDKVSYKGDVCEVYEIKFDKLNIIKNEKHVIVSIKNVSSILLTDEILDKLRFNSHKGIDDTFYYYNKLI